MAILRNWRLHLALACALFAGAAFAESCITADEYNHTLNGGVPLPGTTTQSVSGLSVSIDAETFCETLYGPFHWPFGFLLILR